MSERRRCAEVTGLAEGGRVQVERGKAPSDLLVGERCSEMLGVQRSEYRRCVERCEECRRSRGVYQNKNVAISNRHWTTTGTGKKRGRNPN
jgi:hypothetical protein